jgi:Protein of unknown function (DUF2505)
MPEITLRHEFECDEDTYWHKVTFDPDFNKRLYLSVLRFPGYELVDQKEDDQKLTRKVHIDPPLGNLPGAVKKAIGDKFSYLEEGTFDKKTRRYAFKITPSTMAEKTKNVGELYCEKVGEKRVARVAKITLEVKVFMIGGLIEEKIMGDLRTSYDSAARFTREFLKEKGL